MLQTQKLVGAKISIEINGLVFESKKACAKEHILFLCAGVNKIPKT